MADLAHFAGLESPLKEEPLFFVQDPDGRKDWSEDKRQRTFVTLMHRLAPRVMVHHIRNEGAYNHARAKGTGLVSGVFDIRADFRAPLSAAIEFKGYSKAGRPGDLSPQQIAWGNRMDALGYPVACFFDPYDAADWLRGLGFPVRSAV